MTILVGTFLMPFGAFLCQVMHPKLGILLGTTIGISTTIAASYVTNFWAFFALFGIGYGLAVAVLYMIPIVTGWSYFPHKKGMVSGIVIAGFSVGGSIFNLVTTKIVNPNNLPTSDGSYYDEEVYCRVPKMLRLLAACWGGLCFLAFLLVSKKSA